MEYISILVQNHEDWEAETLRMIQSLHQLRSLLNRSIAFLLARIVIHVKIHEVIVHRLIHRRILLYEIGKAQTPWTPVATHLTNHELAFSLRLLQALVYLGHRVDSLIIHSLQCSLSMRHHHDNRHHEGNGNHSFHTISLFFQIHYMQYILLITHRRTYISNGVNTFRNFSKSDFEIRLPRRLLTCG